MTERLCEKCGQPLPEGAHFNTRYHPTCQRRKARLAQLERTKRYYRQHAEALRERRRAKYQQEKRRIAAPEA